MKVIFFILVLTTITLALDQQEQWQNFLKTYNKSYSTKEQSERFQIFCQNLKLIEEHNKKYDLGLTSYKMGVNQFSDITPEEFKKQFLKPLPLTNFKTSSVKIQESNLTKFDWRDKNVVTMVRNHNACGDSSVMSTLETVEGQHALKTGKLTEYSEDCLTYCMRYDCSGGTPEIAYFGMKTYGIYEYNGRCNCTPAMADLNLTSWTHIKNLTEEGLKNKLVEIGPLSVGIDGFVPYSYQSGIFPDKDCDDDVTTHNMLLVGFGEEDGTEYWILKNSWATSWGEDGYMRLERNKNNTCRITEAVYYPTLDI